MMKQLLSILVFATSIPAASFAKSERVISVHGSCTKQVVPDRGSITLASEFLDKDLKKSVKRATETYEEVRKKIQALKLPNFEMTTSEYSVQEMNEWQKDRNVFKGFRTRMGLQIVTSDIKRLGEVIPIASEHEIRDVGQISLFLSDELSDNERRGCLQDATRDAKRKAEKIAQGAGVSLGPVQSITEGADAGGPIVIQQRQMMKSAMAMEADAAGAPPSIESGKQTIRVSVNASFEIN